MPRGLISGIITGFGYALVVELISHFALLIISFLLQPSFPEYISLYPYLSPFLSARANLWGTFAFQVLIYMIWIWFGYDLGKTSTGIEGLKSDTYYVSISVPISVAVFSFIIDNEMLKISGNILYNMIDVIRVYFSVALIAGLISGITVFFINLIRR